MLARLRTTHAMRTSVRTLGVCGSNSRRCTCKRDDEVTHRQQRQTTSTPFPPSLIHRHPRTSEHGDGATRTDSTSSAHSFRMRDTSPVGERVDSW